MKISAVIITYNEANNIARCLNSIKKVADEIIVIDSFSIDNTIEICDSFDAKITQRKFEGYGDQKNYGIGQATNEYILSLDADEELSHQLQLSILNIKQKNEVELAYKFNRRNHIAGKWINYGVWYPDCKMRLWQKEKGLWDNAFVHEKVDLQSGISANLLKGDLNHYTASSFNQLKITNEKYADLSAKQMHANNKKHYVFNISIKPIFAFVKAFIIKRGFLDGWMGFKLAKENMRYTYLKYINLFHLNKSAKKHE